jgi:hypothetical protein
VTVQPCSICQKKSSDAQWIAAHHTNYDRDETIPLCHDCHMDVHQKPGFSDELCPEDKRQWSW